MNGGEKNQSGTNRPDIRLSGDTASARPNQSSILSAPRNERHRNVRLAFICLGALFVVSLIFNIVLLETSSHKTSENNLLKREIADYQKEIDDLKGRLREQ